jgi:glycosyltransferase involved in cell wall biosynthesis
MNSSILKLYNLKKPINILHVHSVYLPYIGGSSLRLKSLIEPLSKKGLCNIFVLVPKNINKGGSLCDDIIPSYEVINNIKIFRVNSIYNIPIAVRKLSKKYNIDIIHAHNPRFAFYSLISFVDKSLIFENHTLKELRLYKEILTKLVYLISDRVITLSKTAKEYLCNKYKLSDTKVDVIVNGIDLKRFTLSDSNNKLKIELGFNKDNLIIGYCGSFSVFQGVYEFVKSIPFIINANEKCRFLLVGGGPEFENIISLVEELGVRNKVKLTGIVLPEKVPEYMSCMDVFVMPRPSNRATETTIPLKIFEAMAMKKPIIATNVGGISEVLEDNIDAFLVPPNDEIALAKGIVDLLRDKSCMSKISNNARKKVEKHYSWSESSMKLFSIYKTIIQEKKIKH